MIRRLFFVLLVAVAVASCTPKSAYVTKAVILDGYNDIEVVENRYLYKVYVPAYGIMDSYADWKLYDQGDTILISDKWHSYEIK